MAIPFRHLHRIHFKNLVNREERPVTIRRRHFQYNEVRKQLLHLNGHTDIVSTIEMGDKPVLEAGTLPNIVANGRALLNKLERVK